MNKSSEILIYFLLFLLFFNSTKVSLTYLYYKIDPIGFIEALCENKDQPELQCNGMCHLKKVSQTQNEEQKTPESIIDFKQLVFYQHQVSEFMLVNDSRSQKQAPLFYLNLYTFSQTFEWFHPPRV